MSVTAKQGECRDDVDPATPPATSAGAVRIDSADGFYANYKGWVNELNRRFEGHGLWNDEFRIW